MWIFRDFFTFVLSFFEWGNNWLPGGYFADVDIGDEEDDGRAESARECRHVHHADALCEHGQLQGQIFPISALKFRAIFTAIWWLNVSIFRIGNCRRSHAASFRIWRQMNAHAKARTSWSAARFRSGSVLWMADPNGVRQSGRFQLFTLTSGENLIWPMMT